MDSSVQVQCCLCLDEVRVPVKIKAFRCPKAPGKPSCHDVNRVCLICARNYLHLNTFPAISRPDAKKCLFCPTTIDLRYLNAQKAYEKDFMLMSLMPRKDYPCFHSELGCVFTGSQNELDRHMQSECKYRMTKCECGVFHKVIDGPQHYQQCQFYEKCSFCLEWINTSDIDAHLTNHKAARCCYCVKIFPDAVLVGHKERCPDKPMNCELCHKFIFKKQMGDHLMSHVNKGSQEVQSFVRQLANANDFLKAAIHALGKFNET